MFRVVKGKKETRICQKRLETALRESLSSESEFKIGSPGGSMNSVIYNSNVWFAGYEITEESSEGAPRFWNGFGLTSKLEQGKSNSIVVEINIPTNGINPRVSGLFAIDDDTGSVFLLHRGCLGGGKGIGGNSFLNWYSKPFTEIQNETDNETHVEKAILVGEITKSEFPKHLAKFVQSVAEFKLFATSVKEASSLSVSELEEKINSQGGKSKPKRKNLIGRDYDRCPYISRRAKLIAKGKCQLCKKTAPFKNKDGEPYLETHHIKWLSKGGEDSKANTIALSPNCHRKMHVVNLKQDIQKLKKTVASLNKAL